MLNVRMKVRQFVNVVTESYNGGLYSLRRIKASDLFYASREEALLKEAEQAKKAMTQSRLPNSRIKFSQCRPVDDKIDFLPFYGRDNINESKIVCIDTAGLAVVYDADRATVETLPCLHKPKGSSLMGLSVTRSDAHDPAWPDALYVMDKIHGNFEALIYGDPSPYLIGRNADNFVWRWHQLPPPPYLSDPTHGSVRSYTLLDDNTICISSATGEGGTYCFNTVKEQWTKAGCWVLPFYGRAQVVPELNNLCFGIADSSPNHFCALDLSSMDRAPKLQHHWPDMETPVDWSLTDASMAYMGAGKFCIAKTFKIFDQDTGDLVSISTVLNGVEVVHKNGGTSKSKLGMIRHKSNCYSLVDQGIRCIL